MRSLSIIATAAAMIAALWGCNHADSNSGEFRIRTGSASEAEPLNLSAAIHNVPIVAHIRIRAIKEMEPLSKQDGTMLFDRAEIEYEVIEAVKSDSQDSASLTAVAVDSCPEHEHTQSRCADEDAIVLRQGGEALALVRPDNEHGSIFAEIWTIEDGEVTIEDTEGKVRMGAGDALQRMKGYAEAEE